MGTVHVIKNKIRIYLHAREHNPPHIRVVYAEYEAQIEIKTGNVLRGELPTPQLREVKQWLKAPDVKKKLEEGFHRLNPELRRRG